MESPRLRLLILGSLRGIVKPGYRLGINSRVREELLLNALQREIDGEVFEHRSSIEAAIAQISIPSARPNICNQAIDFLLQGSMLRKGHSYACLKKAARSAKTEMDIKQAAAAFNILKSTDFYGRMHRTLKAALR